MGDSRRLVSKLRELSGPGAQTMHRDSCEWMFQLGDTQTAMLDWLCSSIAAANLLDPSELEEFDSLKRTKGGLDNDQLDALISCSDDADAASIDPDKLAEAVQAAELELISKKRDLRRQQWLKNRLRSHQASLKQRLSSLEVVEAEVNAAEKLMQENWQQESIQLRDVLDTVEASFVEAAAMKTELDTSSCAHPRFLTQLPMGGVYDEQETATHTMLRFMETQLDNGITASLGDQQQDEEEEYELVSGDRLLLHGPTEAQYECNCAELQRLRALHAPSERRRAEAGASAAAVTATLASAEGAAADLRRGRFPQEQSELRNALCDAQRKQLQLSVQLGEVTRPLPGLIAAAARLATFVVLTGDYDYKLLRQDYYIRRQDQVIELLLQQCAQQEVVAVATLAEHERLVRIQEALAALVWRLRDHACDAAGRCAGMEELRGAWHTRRHQVAVDSSDAFLQRVQGALASRDDETKVFVQLKTLLSSADTLGSAAPAARHEGAPALRARIARWQETACDGVEPALRHPRLGGALSGLAEMLASVDLPLEGVVGRFEAHRKTLAVDERERRARGLFALFFTDAARFRQAVQFT